MDSIDHYDFSKLLSAIIRQALDDYVKLQHPKYRRKKYLIEAYNQAIDMFFDPEYRFVALQNDEGEDMSLEDLLKAALNTQRVDIQKIRDHAISEAILFWETKEIRTVEIPETVQVAGHVYHVEHKEEPGYTIDYNEKILRLNKKQGGEQEKCFVDAVFEIVLYHEDIPIKKTNMRQMSQAWFQALKINNCFSGAD